MTNGSGSGRTNPDPDPQHCQGSNPFTPEYFTIFCNIRKGVTKKLRHANRSGGGRGSSSPSPVVGARGTARAPAASALGQ
jgi:hypothetical protein